MIHVMGLLLLIPFPGITLNLDQAQLFYLVNHNGFADKQRRI